MGVVNGVLAGFGGLVHLLQYHQLPYVNRNVWAIFPVTALVAICLALHVTGAFRRQLLLGVLAAVNGVWVFLSASRGGLLVACVCLAFVSVRIRGRRRVVFVSAAAALSMVVITQFPQFEERALARWDELMDRTTSLSYRTNNRADLDPHGLAYLREQPVGHRYRRVRGGVVGPRTIRGALDLRAVRRHIGGACRLDEDSRGKRRARFHHAPDVRGVVRIRRLAATCSRWVDVGHPHDGHPRQHTGVTRVRIQGHMAGGSRSYAHAAHAFLRTRGVALEPPRPAAQSSTVRPETEQLRVALLAGTLGQGGAEKQLLYMAGALRSAGVDVKVYSLTRGEFYERAFRDAGLPPVWVGRLGQPVLRLMAVVRELRRFRPHIIQSAHSFANLYVALAARLLGSLSVGAMRSSLHFTLAGSGLLTRWSLTAPQVLVVNSRAAERELVASRLIAAERVAYVPNTIDLQSTVERTGEGSRPLTAIFVGRLIPIKRLDCFVMALSLARRRCPALRGVVVGDGPAKASSEVLAQRLALDPSALTFLGRRDDVPSLLSQADMLVHCSDDEGFPNVLLEAMAARVPVVTTPAGDAPSIVQDGVTAYVVPFGDEPALADRMVRLAESGVLRREFGDAGRRRVEQTYAGGRLLASRLLSVYRRLAQQHQHAVLLQILSSVSQDVRWPPRPTQPDRAPRGAAG